MRYLKTLLTDLLDERRVSARCGLAKAGPIELRRDPLGAFPRDVGKALHLVGPALGARGVHGLAVVVFVTPGKVFEATEVIATVENTQRRRIDFGDGHVKVRSAFLDVPNNKARTIRTHAELHIDRVQELA